LANQILLYTQTTWSFFDQPVRNEIISIVTSVLVRNAAAALLSIVDYSTCEQRESAQKKSACKKPTRLG
jgi:hypothetical protein